MIKLIEYFKDFVRQLLIHYQLAVVVYSALEVAVFKAQITQIAIGY